MADLGKECQPTDLLHYDCEALICALYGVPGVPINEARYKLFCAKSPVLLAATNQGCSRKTCPAGLLSSSYMATRLDVQT